MGKDYIPTERYGSGTKDYTIGKGREPVELIGEIKENFKKYFILKVKKDQYLGLEKKSISIPKSECLMERLEDGNYRVLIPMWLHDKKIGEK